MLKLTADELQILAQVAGTFPKLRELLKRRYDEHVDSMVQAADDSRLRQTQGRAAELRELIKLFDEARNAR